MVRDLWALAFELLAGIDDGPLWPFTGARDRLVTTLLTGLDPHAIVQHARPLLGLERHRCEGVVPALEPARVAAARLVTCVHGMGFGAAARRAYAMW